MNKFKDDMRRRRILQQNNKNKYKPIQYVLQHLTRNYMNTKMTSGAAETLLELELSHQGRRERTDIHC